MTGTSLAFSHWPAILHLQASLPAKKKVVCGSQNYEVCTHFFLFTLKRIKMRSYYSQTSLYRNSIYDKIRYNENLNGTIS